MTCICDEENAILVSAASAWEISTKWRLGKLPQADGLIGALGAICRSQRFEPLAITLAHAECAGALPGPHRDPFDRMLAAQAQIEAIPIITNDRAIAGFGVRVLW